MQFKFKHENPEYETIEVANGTYFAKMQNEFDTTEMDYFKFTVEDEDVKNYVRIFDTLDETRIIRKPEIWEMPYILQKLYVKGNIGEFITQDEFDQVFRAALAKISNS